MRRTLSPRDRIAVSGPPGQGKASGGKDVLAERGHQRRIALNVPHWLVVPHVLKQTDLLAVMPRHLAAVTMDDGLRMEDLPFESAPFAWMLYWHRRYDQSNANGWLRERIRAVCTDLN